jgi:hypothetical protein
MYTALLGSNGSVQGQHPGNSAFQSRPLARAGGSWWLVNAFGILEGVTRTLQPFPSGQFTTLGADPAGTDSSGLVHLGSTDSSFAIRRRTASATFVTNPNVSHVFTVTGDSNDRVIAAGQIGTDAVVQQLGQTFAAATDIFGREYTTQLDIESPGVLNNDVAFGGGVLAVITPPTKGTVTLNQDGSFRYVPNASTDGNDQFQYSITKGNATRTATCFIKRVTVASLTLTPNPDIGEDVLSCKVTLSTSQIDLPLKVNVTCSTPSILDTSFLLQPGTSSQTRSIQTPVVIADTAVTFTAALSGASTAKTVVLKHGGLFRIKHFQAQRFIAGEDAKIDLILTGPAATERVYQLSYPGSNATGPATATVPAGSSIVTVTIHVSGGVGATLTVAAHRGFSTARSLNDTIGGPSKLASVSVTPTPIYAGVTQQFEATLDASTGAQGVNVSTSSSNASVVMGSTIAVAAGQPVGQINFLPPLALGNTNLTLTGTLGSVSKSTTFLVRPNLLDTFSISPIVIPSRGATSGRITFNWVATGSGINIAVKTNRPDIISVPDTVKMPTGQTVVNFPIVSRGGSGSANITVAVGQKGITQSITITP